MFGKFIVSWQKVIYAFVITSHQPRFLNNSSAFLIGSIDEVNRRISKLDEKLQHYTQLVVESRVSDTSSSMTDIVAYSDMVRDTHKKKGKETFVILGLMIHEYVVHFCEHSIVLFERQSCLHCCYSDLHRIL